MDRRCCKCYYYIKQFNGSSIECDEVFFVFGGVGELVEGILKDGRGQIEGYVQKVDYEYCCIQVLYVDVQIWEGYFEGYVGNEYGDGQDNDVFLFNFEFFEFEGFFLFFLCYYLFFFFLKVCFGLC